MTERQQLIEAVELAVKAEEQDLSNSVALAMDAFELMEAKGYDWQQDGGAVRWALFGAKATTAEILTYCLPRALRFLGLAVAA
jgi:hypothetical protein